MRTSLPNWLRPYDVGEIEIGKPFYVCRIPERRHEVLVFRTRLAAFIWHIALHTTYYVQHPPLIVSILFALVVSVLVWLGAIWLIFHLTR